MYSLWFWFVLMSRLFVKAAKLLMRAYSCISRSTPVMLGIYISIFVILANILFICAIYSCIKVNARGGWEPAPELFVAHYSPLLFWSSFRLPCRRFQRRSSSLAPTAPWSECLASSSFSSLPLSTWWVMDTETEPQRHLFASLGNKSTLYSLVGGTSAD